MVQPVIGFMTRHYGVNGNMWLDDRISGRYSRCRGPSGIFMFTEQNANREGTVGNYLAKAGGDIHAEYRLSHLQNKSSNYLFMDIHAATLAGDLSEACSVSNRHYWRWW